MEEEFAAGLRQVFGRIGLAGPAMEEILATQKNASPRTDAPLYTQALADRVAALYAHDFRVLGYSTDSWRGL